MNPVTVDDADELAELERGLFPENCLNEHTLAREITLGFGWLIPDRVTGSTAGYILCRGDSRLVDVIRLGVVPAHQRLGHGGALLTQALVGAERAMLTVHPANERALRLYRRHGFEIVGRLHENNWVMGWTRPGRGAHFIGVDL